MKNVKALILHSRKQADHESVYVDALRQSGHEVYPNFTVSQRDEILKQIAEIGFQKDIRERLWSQLGQFETLTSLEQTVRHTERIIEINRLTIKDERN